MQIGLGRLPDWLRNKREVISLDTFNDSLCVFRCIAVHQGADKKYNIRRIRELARSFFAAHPKLGGNDNVITLQQFHLLERHFKRGIAAYSVTGNGDFVLSYTPSCYDKVGPPTMAMGIYEAHASLITDINKVTNNYTCGECLARFTRASDLTRHIKTCTRGRNNIACPGNRILAPESAFEKVFYPEANFGIKATCWLEYEARQRGIHIHHHRCGHGGERTVACEKVDGYHPETKTVFQYHGCFWHGCLECYPRPEQRNEAIWIDRKGNEITTLNTESEYICSKDPEELISLFYQSLVQRSALIRADVAERYIPSDFEGLSKDQQNLINQWCDEVPVVGFNSGRYDLHLIRKYFITHLGQENGVLSGEKQGQIMYINTPHFKFLDITNYLSPGIS